MARQIEDMDRPIPNNLTRMCFMDRHRLDKRGNAAVLGFHGLFQFGWCYFGHGRSQLTVLFFHMPPPRALPRCVLVQGASRYAAQQHKSLRVTTAMAAGVSDRMWSLEELVEQTAK